MNITYRWHFHFNAMHNITPDDEEAKHPHSFLVILCMEIAEVNLVEQKQCEKDVRKYIDQYVGKYLNEMNEFQNQVPTIEVICEKMYYDIEKIVEKSGMKLIQIEVGDSPVKLFAMGNQLLLGSSYGLISDKDFQEYRRRLNL